MWNPQRAPARPSYHGQVGIHCLNGRVFSAELMDTAPEAAARDSLRDLIRINRYFGGHLALRAILSTLVTRTERFSVLDLGAASGDMAREITRQYPNARVVSLDYKSRHLAAAPNPRVAADAFRLPFQPRTFDFVFSSLFLHHFPDARVVDLLHSAATVSRRAVLAIDLHRHPLAYYFVPATRWLFGWHPLTVHDAKLSVESAFHPRELEALARRAGLTYPRVRQHIPWFRLSLVAPVT